MLCQQKGIKQQTDHGKELVRGTTNVKIARHKVQVPSIVYIILHSNVKPYSLLHIPVAQAPGVIKGVLLGLGDKYI